MDANDGDCISYHDIKLVNEHDRDTWVGGTRGSIVSELTSQQFRIYLGGCFQHEK